MPRRWFSALLVLLVSVVASPSRAAAQMTDIDAYGVRVISDQADVRCGWGSDGWYSVGRVPRGTVLWADGREGDWLRVRYPEDLGFGVLLRFDDVQLDEAAGTATLTRPARPIHRNRQNPVGGSWMKLTGDPIAPGTSFEVLSVLEDQGAPALVLVAAPDRVRGYVLATDVERADAEGPAPAPPPAQAAPESAPEASTPTPTAVPAAPDAAAAVAPGESSDKPAPASDAGESDAAAAVTIERAAPTADQLVASYDAVVREQIEDAELDPLIEEFRGAVASASDERQRARLAARLDLLEIRRDLQQDLRAVTSASQRAAMERDAIDRLVIDWRSRPAYTVVGRLMASALYDGRRLPLMYRLQSLDGPGGRTIAYILPNVELDLNAKVGGVVGVVGDARRDRTIKVRLIEPVRIDVLEPGN